MKKIAAIGTGNIGKAVAKAIELSPDMELLGFIRRKEEKVRGFENIPAVRRISDLPEKPDGAIICLPSRLVKEAEEELLKNGIYTADAFDIHEELLPLRQRLSAAARMGKVSAVIGAGWDPGLDSVIRTLMLAALPQGITYTNFGPGTSMGHSAAIRQIPGICDAVSFTLPQGFGKHSRKIYAVLEKDADKNAVEHAILNDEYFEHDECSVEFVESTLPFCCTGHSAEIFRGGNICGTGGNRLSFGLCGDNPAFTAQLLVCAMRAAFLQKPGAYFMPEIPPCDFCSEGWEKTL